MDMLSKTIFSLNIHCTRLLCHTDIDAASSTRSVQEDGVDPTLHTTPSSSETEHYEQPAERDEEKEAGDEEETKPEQLHKVHQSQEEHDNNNKEADAGLPRHQQEAVPDEAEDQHEGETPRESPESEDTEQVETFFSTMSHRYENATQEGHIL